MTCDGGKFRNLIQRSGRLDRMKSAFKERFGNDTLQHECTIKLSYYYGRDKVLTQTSEPFYYPGGARKHKRRHKKAKTFIWAIPVALVLVACLFGLLLMVYKYRRLQHSFLAFAARSSYTRQENDFDDDDDDNMVVGFRSGNDAFLFLFSVFQYIVKI